VRVRRSLEDVEKVDLSVTVRRDEVGEDSGAEDDPQAEHPEQRKAMGEEAHARVRPLAADLEVEPRLERALDAGTAYRIDRRAFDRARDGAVRRDRLAFDRLRRGEELSGVRMEPRLSHNGSAGRGSRRGCRRWG